MFEQQQLPVPAPTAITQADIAMSPHAQALAEIEQALGPLISEITRAGQIVSQLLSELECRRRRRYSIEQEWLDCFRRCNGEYDPATKARFTPGKSQIWMGFTAHKVAAAHATIMDYLAGSEDRCWDLDPEPIPFELMQDRQLLSELQARGISPKAFQSALQAEMRERVSRLVTRMEDQLERADFINQMDRATLECCITGSMCLMGPLTVPDYGTEYGIAITGSGEIKPHIVERRTYRPDVRFVSILDVWPDMESHSVQDSDGIFERMFLTRSQLIDLAGQPGFNPAGVLQVLKMYPAGNAVIDPALNALRVMGGDGDAGTTSKYEVYVWYGPLTGRIMEQCGAKVPEHLQDAAVTACIWFCGSTMLKAKVHQGEIPYYIAPYCIRPGHGPFGRGIPMLCKNSQDAVNASARMMLDNAAISAGPLIDCNMRLMRPGEDPRDVKAWKVFVSDHDGEQSKRALNVFELPNYTNLFISLIQLFRQYLDEESFIPSLTGGEQGVRTTDTATGMSILNTNGNRMVKKVMRGMDSRIIKPLISAYVAWNQQFGDDDSIICRAAAKPKGASSIMAREIQTQRLMQMTQMFGQHPAFKTIEAGREITLGLDLDSDRLWASEDELRGQTAISATSGAGPDDPATQQAMMAAANQPQPGMPQP